MTPTTADAVAGESRPGGFARAASFVLMALCAFALLAGSLRLALVVAGTPSALWLVEYPSLLPQPGLVSDAEHERAARASDYVADPHLVTALLGPCTDARAEAVASGDFPALQAASRDCVAVIDRALAEAPLSGELWLQRAALQFQLGDCPAFTESLRASYQTAPREGWIAVRRAIAALPAFDALPSDLQALVEDDLRLLLGHKSLADPFVAEFVSSPVFREQALPVIERLPAADQETFLGFVHAAGRE